MATHSVSIGTAERLEKLYSYPNDPTSGESLSETILHWFNQTLQRDGFAAEGATASVRVEGDQYYLDIAGPAEVAEYGKRLPQFLDHGWDALGVVEKLKTETTTWPEGLAIPTENRVWDPQNTGQWRFFLPLGMAMIRQRTLNFFHYPPIRLLNAMRDYLDDPVPVRLIELMEVNGVTGDAEAWLYSTVMDGAPIAAPDDQGTQYIPHKPPVHLIPIAHFHEYQKAQVNLLLDTSAASEDHTIPIVVFGSPARASFKELYGVKPSSRKAATIEIIPGKKTAVLGSGHPYRFYAQAQIDDATGANVGSGRIIPNKCADAVQVMVDDLVVVRWQCQMAQDPTQDPQVVLDQCRQYWESPERAAEVCRLVQHQGSLLYPDPKSLKFTFRLTLDQAADVCSQHGNNPCARDIV
jgi:hypothetical protein